MFGTILAALDGSPKSEAALGTAIDEAKAWKASLMNAMTSMASFPPFPFRGSVRVLLREPRTGD